MVNTHQKPSYWDEYTAFQGTFCLNTGSETRHSTFIKLTFLITQNLGNGYRSHNNMLSSHSSVGGNSDSRRLTIDRHHQSYNPRHPYNPRQSETQTTPQSCKSLKSCFRQLPLPRLSPSHLHTLQQPVRAAPYRIPPQGYRRSLPSPSHLSDTPR